MFSREQTIRRADDLRLADLMRFATDRSIDVVLSGRGGYGLSRLLDRIDFAAIKARAPVIAGYSDFTAFSLAYLARAGGVSLSGPSAGDFGAASPDDYTIEHFFGLIESPRLRHRTRARRHAAEFSGRLWGGNLVMLAALLGTPYFPRVRGGILVVEDVNEPAYKTRAPASINSRMPECCNGRRPSCSATSSLSCRCRMTTDSIWPR